MHHVALDRAGTYDGYFNYQVIKVLWLQTGQHSLLRAALYLENPDSISMPYHFIHTRIILWNIRKSKVQSIILFRFIKCFTDTCKHSKRKHIYFQKSQGIYIILV